MEQFLIELVGAYGYLGILALIALENIFPPIPSEIILTLGGFMTTYTQMTVTGVIFFSTIGSVMGAIILYGLGRVFTGDRLDAILSHKIVLMLGFKKKHIYKAIDMFASKGKITVLFTRCVPIVRSLISIPAGVAQMNFATFLLYTTVGTLLWNTLLVNIGAYAGSSWKDAVAIFDRYSSLLLLLFLVIIVAGLIVYFIKNKKDH